MLAHLFCAKIRKCEMSPLKLGACNAVLPTAARLAWPTKFGIFSSENSFRNRIDTAKAVGKIKVRSRKTLDILKYAFALISFEGGAPGISVMVSYIIETARRLMNK